MITKKTYIFGGAIGATLLGVIIYFSYCLKRMKRRIQQIEEIVGLIPFKRLCTIIGFKKHIRKKYEEEGY